VAKPVRRIRRRRKTEAETGPELSHRFGAAQRVVEALGDVSNRTVIEIGRDGVLTDVLAVRAKHVIGIELDGYGGTAAHAVATRRLEILESDFVAAEFTSMVGRRPGPLHDLRPTQPETVDVIGNLPTTSLRYRAADSGIAPAHRARRHHGAARGC